MAAAASQAAFDSLATQLPALPVAWAIPFAGLLLSIALIPLHAPDFWHRHYGKVALAWCAVLLVPFAWRYGLGAASDGALHALLIEFVPFIALLFALFVISGGIGIHGTRLAGTPLRNTALLAFGSAIASIVGTTGAAMVLVRPLLDGNARRRHRAHTVVFFIMLVANVGGALSPLGDPPLFVGFLRGVDFFWPLRNLLGGTTFMAAWLLALYAIVDAWLMRRERGQALERGAAAPFRFEGILNVVLLGCVIAVVLASSTLRLGEITILGQHTELQFVLRDVALIGLALVSLRCTPAAIRHDNAFTFGPILEVAKLFAGIFVTIAPVIATLQAGKGGGFAMLVDWVHDDRGMPRDAVVFAVTGALSAFLDNAPTYLVFFNLFGGDPVRLTGTLSSTLTAISMGAVYCGALTYVGNAPNLMVKAIAEERGLQMPEFFAYLGWAVLAMAPPLAAVALHF